MSRIKSLCAACVIFSTVFLGACAPADDDSSSSGALTSESLPAGMSILPRDASETGLVLPMAEPGKWGGSDQGFLFAEFAADTYACYGVYHPGHDLNVLWTGGNGDCQTPVYAVADGVVIDRANYRSRGSLSSGLESATCGRRGATINEWGSITVLFHYKGVPLIAHYGHMWHINVGLGDVVRRGQAIGDLGSVGTRNSHLHFEIRDADHVCHDGVADTRCDDNDGIVRTSSEPEYPASSVRPSQYFCRLLVNRADVLRMYRNPVESIVSMSMDLYADDTVGLSALGASVLPGTPAFSIPTAMSSNPSTESRGDLYWLRGRPSTSSADIINALVREYRPSAWGGRPGYLVHPVNHGARRPYWVRSAFGESWSSMMSGTSSTPRRCGLPVTGEYLNCPESVSPCRSVRQDFQTCYMTWQEGRSPELVISDYSRTSPGAFANNWLVRTPRGDSLYDSSGYTHDDSGYIVAEAYERNGAAARMGEAYAPVSQLGDSRYLAQPFSGGEYGRALVVFDPEDAIVSSYFVYASVEFTEALIYRNHMSMFRDATGNPQGIVYGDRVDASVIRTGFLDWYERYDGVRRLGAPLNDEYQWPVTIDRRSEVVARQDFESGNCLLWVWDRPSVGRAYCGSIEGARCVDFLDNTERCPFVGIALDGGSRSPVPLGLPPPSSGYEGGGGSIDPDAGTPSFSPDAGMPFTPPDAGTPFVPPDAGPPALPDSDGDGWDDASDCYPRNPEAHPRGIEVCDNVDNDCTGITDDGISDHVTSNVCGTIIERCFSGIWMRVSGRDPIPEVCNENDDDCDGSVDEGACAPPLDPYQVRIRLSDTFLTANPCVGGWEIQLWLGSSPAVSPRGGELVTTFAGTSGWSSVTLWCYSRTPAWPPETAWSGSTPWSFAELSLGGSDLRSTTRLCHDPAASPGSDRRPIIMWDPARRGSCPP